MKRLLRRRVIIRDYDFVLLKPSAEKLYDRVWFEPVTVKELEQDMLVSLLKNPERDSYLYSDPLANVLQMIKIHLYNKDYYKWNCKETEEGYIQVYYRSTAKNANSILGWAYFEKDPE
jgi:predicted acetyltransferase